MFASHPTSVHAAFENPGATACTSPSERTGGSPATKRFGCRNRRGMTLVEVMIALIVVLMFALSITGLMNLTTRWTMEQAYRSEAHRIAQETAERLLAGPYSQFAAESDETIVSSVSTSFARSTIARFVYPNIPEERRVSFTRNVEQVAATSSTRHLRVNVSWSVAGRASSLSLPVYRAN